MERDLVSTAARNTPTPPAGPLLGFATVVQDVGAQSVGVWLTSATGPLWVGHSNAVVCTREEPVTMAALMHGRIVVAAGDDHSNLPTPVTLEQLRSLFREAVAEMRGRVDLAVDAHARSTRNQNLIRPDWSVEPSPGAPASAAVQHRTLAAADHVADLWRWWLSVEEERRKRVNFPSMVTAGLADTRRALLPRGIIGLM